MVCRRQHGASIAGGGILLGGQLSHLAAYLFVSDGAVREKGRTKCCESIIVLYSARASHS